MQRSGDNRTESNREYGQEHDGRGASGGTAPAPSSSARLNSSGGYTSGQARQASPGRTRSSAAPPSTISRSFTGSTDRTQLGVRSLAMPSVVQWLLLPRLPFFLFLWLWCPSGLTRSCLPVPPRPRSLYCPAEALPSTGDAKLLLPSFLMST